MNAFQRLGLSLKAARMAFNGAPVGWWSGLYSAFRWRPWRAVGNFARHVDPQGNSAVSACLLWIARNFPEAPPVTRDAAGEVIEPHPLTQLLRRPNNHYSGATMWMATVIDFNATGNAYWLKVRNSQGRVIELWYTPSWMIRPAWSANGAEFISHYEYEVDGRVFEYAPTDVVHFRFSLDPLTRCGISPLSAVLNEIFIDDEAQRFTAALLKNLGIPGVILAPKDPSAEVDDETAEQLKDKFEARFGGEKRGSVMVMQNATEVAVLSFSPQQMDLKSLRRIPEERITAALGVPAMVVGLGAGLDRSTYSNYSEAREAAYENGIIPTQRLFAAEMDLQLLPDFAGVGGAAAVDFDLSKVRVLQTDEDKMASRLATLFSAGMITRAEARRQLGEDVRPEDEVFALPSKTVLIPAGLTPEAAAEATRPQPQPAPAATNEGDNPAEPAAKVLTVTYPDLTAADVESFYRERLAEIGRNGHG